MSEPLAVGSVSMRIYPHDLPAAGQIAEARLQARLAAEAGFDGVMVAEHHAGFPGYFPNPHQIVGFMLADMPTGWVACAPMLLPMLPYITYAELVAWLNAAYPGRVGAGFALGAFPNDFSIVDVPFEEITDRFKAALPKVVAALRGEDPTVGGQDRALLACKENPIPMVVATQSTGAIRRAARLGIGVLFDSLQTNEHSVKLSDLYDELGGTGPKMLIRRVWIGDPPTEQASAQMEAFMNVAREQAVKNWGDADQLVIGSTGEEAAEKLAEVLRESHADTVNIRIHLKGLSPEQIRNQIERHGSEFLPHFRKIWTGAK